MNYDNFYSKLALFLVIRIGISEYIMKYKDLLEQGKVKS